MDASTRAARIPRASPAAEPKRQQLECPPQRRLQDFLALRAESDTDSQLPQPLADRVRRHSKYAGDRQHRAHHAQHAQRHGRHASGETERRPSNLFHVSMSAGSPGSSSRSLLLMAAASCCGSRLERTTRHVRPRWRLQDGEKHRRLRIFGQAHDIFRLRQCPPPGRAFHPAACSIRRSRRDHRAEDLRAQTPDSRRPRRGAFLVVMPGESPCPPARLCPPPQNIPGDTS